MTALRFRKKFLVEIRALRDLRELEDDWAHRREFHIGDDDLILYVRKERTGEVIFHRAGTHKRLFRRRIRRKSRSS